MAAGQKPLSRLKALAREEPVSACPELPLTASLLLALMPPPPAKRPWLRLKPVPASAG